MVVTAEEEVKLLWEGEELSGEENGSEKFERRERPADNSWHMADTASPGLVSTTGDISGMGVTVQNMHEELQPILVVLSSKKKIKQNESIFLHKEGMLPIL